MSGKYGKTSTNDVEQTSEYDVKMPGKSDGYNLSQLYPSSPQYNGYADKDVIELAKKLLKSKKITILENPDFPEGIKLDYNHKTLPDQKEVKQTKSSNPPLQGEGYAPLPAVTNGAAHDDVAPYASETVEFDNLPNVKKSTKKSVIEVGDVLLPGKQK